MLHSSKFVMLGEIPILNKLTKQELDILAEKSTFFTVQKGLPIYNIEDKISNIYFLHKGSIKLGTTTTDGKDLIKDILFESDIFGENVFTSKKRTEFAISLEDCKLFSIPLAHYNELIESNANFREAILELMVSNLKKLQDRRQNFVFSKAKQRIMHFIQKLAAERGIKIGIDEILVHHKLSHKEIANVTDTSRQTVARVLSELKEDKIIYFSPRKPTKILVRNILKLT